MRGFFQLEFGHFQGKGRWTAKSKPLKKNFHLRLGHFPRKFEGGVELSKKKKNEEFCLLEIRPKKSSLNWSKDIRGRQVKAV